MIHDVEHETMPREDLEALQLRRLQAVVERVYHMVPFYRRRMDEMGVKPEHIRTLKDVSLLPLTVKQDLRDNYPFGMFAVPMDQIVRIHASSGTTGKPTPVALHPAGHRHLVRADGPGTGRRRRPPGRYHPQCLRLRPVHRRLGSTMAPSGWAPRVIPYQAAIPDARS